VPVIGAPEEDTRTRYGRIAAHDVFMPQRIDATTGAAVVDFVDPTFLKVHLQLDVTDPRRPDHPKEMTLSDGVALRNRSTFK
jgi:hypothetical protein